MNFFRRCVTILAGYVAAATAAFMVPAYFFFFGFPDNISPSDLPDAIRGVALAMLMVGGALLVPLLFVIAVCEALRIRNMLVYLALGAIVDVAVTIFLVGWGNAGGLFPRPVSIGAGVVAGFIYWWIAGRTAGEWRANPIKNGTERGADKSDIPAA
jgi:hypothetical protein